MEKRKQAGRRGLGGQKSAERPIWKVEAQPKIVGRAELKLAEAVKAFSYDFGGKTVLDIGSSTGGFTELALRKGAKRVIAVEKGTNQMKAPLRYDERVDLYEKTDFLAVKGANKAGNLVVEQGRNEVELVQRVQVQTVVADVSFISLTKILAQARKILPRGVDYLVMLKPQFEAYPDQLVRGVVKNERMRREIIKRFEQWLGRNGFMIVKKRDNETVGKVGGNRERFYLLKSH